MAELATVLKELGEATPAYKIRDMIKEVDLDENGTVEFDEFLAVSGEEEECAVLAATCECERRIPCDCSS